MQIIRITNKGQLNDFIGSQKHSQFLQSWQWGEFQEKVSGHVWRLGAEENGKLIAAASIIKKELPMGKSYFYCPRGPIFGKAEEKSSRISNLLFDEIKKIAGEESAMFLRFEPVRPIANPELLIERTLDVEPSKTITLDLSEKEDELLAGMHQKTRYNIKLAEKKGVKVREVGFDYFEKFWELLGITSGRDNFRSHGKYYYEEMLRTDPDFIKLIVAEYRKDVLAANIVSFFGDTVTYVHGGSSNDLRNIMAPHLLQWHVIKLAKSKGYKFYDFFGIDEEKWPGVTRFKAGFGGETVNYLGTLDLIFDKNWYAVYKMIRKARRTF